MSYARAKVEMERFLSSKEPEVLSISGRWGVGKTYAWDEAIKAARDEKSACGKDGLRSYAYVSLFGIRSLDALKTTIVQSTISLDGPELEPTVKSFLEHIGSFSGIKSVFGRFFRKGSEALKAGASAIPYVGGMAGMLDSVAALLIRDQIICIDDIERAGEELDITNIMGLVSFLRERRKCKIVLLLNADNLEKGQKEKFETYLEKTVDHAIKFEPTPLESIQLSFADNDDKFAQLIRSDITNLGITNIRVIRRIYRFFTRMEPELKDLHSGVAEQVAHSITFLGWCVFEPKLAPPLEKVMESPTLRSLVSREDYVEDKDDQIINAYGWLLTDDLDKVILNTLQSGTFDMERLRAAFQRVNFEFVNEDARIGIQRPWEILGDSFENDEEKLVRAFIESFKNYAGYMPPDRASAALDMLRALDRAEVAADLVRVYVAAQKGKPREYFAQSYDRIDPDIQKSFHKTLGEMPIDCDPGELMSVIGSKQEWSRSDIDYLATISINEYRAALKRLRGKALQDAVRMALQFGRMTSDSEKNYQTVAERVKAALCLISKESRLNGIRLRPYLGAEPDKPASDDGGN